MSLFIYDSLSGTTFGCCDINAVSNDSCRQVGRQGRIAQAEGARLSGRWEWQGAQAGRGGHAGQGRAGQIWQGKAGRQLDVQGMAAMECRSDRQRVSHCKAGIWAGQVRHAATQHNVGKAR